MAKQVQPETEEQKRNREMVETIATSLASLAKGVRALMNGPLNKKALIVLLAQSSGQPQNRVSEILSALERLDADWLNKK